MTNQYDEVFQTLFAYARNSSDRSTQNSAVLLSTEGQMIRQTLAVNNLPHGVQKSPNRLERPTKYLYTEHAERNAIYRAANAGIRTNNLAMVAIWASCADCARAIIQSGVTHLIRYHIDAPSHWNESVEAADVMLSEAEVRITNISNDFPNVSPIFHNGESWVPTRVSLTR
jgi:dCMP deaminase